MFKDGNRHYSLRKLSVGLASVLIGISFASGNSHTVKADTLNDGSDGAQTVVQTITKGNDTIAKDSNTVIKIDAKSNANASATTPKGQNNTVADDSDETTLNVKDSKAITKDMLKEGKSEVKEDQYLTDSSKNRLQISTLNATTNKKFDTKMLSASKVISSANNTNGGFDEATWGKLDSNTNDAFALDSKNGFHEHANINDNGGYNEDFWGKINVDDWNYTINDDRIEINGLKDGASTGVNDAVIVPNLDDFKLTGKYRDAKAVYISKDALSKTAKHKYYGLSKTNGNKFVTDSNISDVFENNSNLTHADLNSLNTSNVIKMSNMFKVASSLTNLNVSKWDTGNVTNMTYMFNGASGLTSLDVSNWNTSNVTDMNNMFNDASSLASLDVSNWNTSNVTDTDYMFNGASSLTNLDVSKWDTSKVATMAFMFNGASKLMSLDVSKWDTGNVVYMNWMFNGASSLTDLNVSNWDTSKVIGMNGMFCGANNLTNLDVSKWDTSNVTDMRWMFSDTSRLTNLDVSKWNTSKVTNMSGMFNGANHLTSLDVSNWNTGNVTDMRWMFSNTSGLTKLDVSHLDTSNVTNMSGMFGSDPKITLIINGDKFADYLVKNNFAKSNVDSGVKSVTTNNAKLIQLLTNDVSESDSATRTIVFTFPANYSPDLTKYHLTKVGSTYQIKQSADYDKPYLQGTVLINATDDITKHHIDMTKPNIISDTWQPNYNKLVLAHKNSDGSVSFDAIRLPKVPGYKAKVSKNNGLLLVSYLALVPKKPKIDTNLHEPQFSNKLVTTNAVNSNIVVKSDMYQIANGDHNWQLPVIKSYELKFATNKNQIIFAYTKNKQYNYRFVLTFKDGQYHLATFDKQNKLRKTYSIKSYKKLAKIIHSLVSMNIA